MRSVYFLTIPYSTPHLVNLEKITKALDLDIGIFFHPNLKVKREFTITIKGIEND